MAPFKNSKLLSDFFYSGWHFDETHSMQKIRFQMLNLAIFLSIVALLEGILRYSSQGNFSMTITEIVLAFINLFFLMNLRKTKKNFSLITFLINLELLLFFFYIVTINPPESLKHIWYFVFPVITFFFEGRNKKKSYLEKLNMKVDFIKKNQDEILNHFKITDKNGWKIKKGFVVNTLYMSAFYKEKVDFVLIDDLEKYLNDA